MVTLVTDEPNGAPQFSIDGIAAKAAYDERGFQLERNLIPADFRSQILEAATELESYADGSFKPTMMPHRTLPAFQSALKLPSVVSIMEQLLGGRVAALQTQFFFGRPGTVGFSAHQDNYYVRSNQDTFASVWIALDDVDTNNGCLRVFPGSHLEPILPVRDVPQLSTFGQDPNANRQEVLIPAGYSPLDVVVQAGDAVFIHGHLIHSSRDNVTTDRWRRVLLMTYIREGAPFREGFAAKRVPVGVYR